MSSLGFGVPRNIDRTGQAGSLVRPLSTVSGGGGGQSPIYDLLAQQARIRNAMAQKQLQLMTEQLNRARSRPRADTSTRHPGILGYAPVQQMREQDQNELLARGLHKTVQGGYGGARTAGDLRDLGRAYNFLGPREVGAGMRTAGSGFANLAAGAQRLATPVEPSSRYNYGGPTRYNPMIATQSRPTQYEEGSLPGTVPETDTYKLHKGEVVLESDQVDEPLLNALVGDKLRKMMDGQIKPKKDKSGEYANGSLGLATSDIDPRIAAAMGLDILPPNPAPRPKNSETRNSVEDLLRAGGDILAGPLDELAAPGLSLIESYLRGEDPREMGEGARESVLEALPSFEGIGQFAEGALGTDAAPTPEATAGPAGTGMAGPADTFGGEHDIVSPGVSDLEFAQNRVAGGDLGSPNDPLSITGDPNAPAQESGIGFMSEEFRQREDEKLAMLRNEQKRDNIARFLRANGQDLDADTYKELRDQVKRIDDIMQLDKSRTQERDERAKDRMLEIDKAHVAYQSAVDKQRAVGEAKQRDDVQRMLRDLNERKNDLETGIWKAAEEGVSDGVMMDMIRKLAQIEWDIGGGGDLDEFEKFEQFIVDHYRQLGIL